MASGRGSGGRVLVVDASVVGGAVSAGVDGSAVDADEAGSGDDVEVPDRAWSSALWVAPAHPASMIVAMAPNATAPASWAMRVVMDQDTCRTTS